MKKLLAVLAVAAFMTSCNNAAESTEAKTDTAAVAPAADTTSKPAADTTAKLAADTTKK